MVGVSSILYATACGGGKTTPTQPAAVTPSTTTASDSPPPPSTPPPATAPTTISEQTLIGAGDIGECTRAGVSKTASLLDRLDGTVFTAGDNVYMTGSADEFAKCYAPTWGRHRSRTRPSAGNHDYVTPDGTGYFSYFGGAAGPGSRGYYSYDLGAWHIIALNTNVPVDRASAQVAWLRADLATTAAKCTLAYFHHPLFSSSENGGSSRQKELWRALHEFKAEVVISAHDHVYERFAPQDPEGRFDAVNGVRQFTVGTGGAKLYGFPRVEPNSEVRSSTWGVIRIGLRANEYSWDFVAVDGEAFRDSGTGTCH